MDAAMGSNAVKSLLEITIVGSVAVATLSSVWLLQAARSGPGDGPAPRNPGLVFETTTQLIEVPPSPPGTRNAGPPIARFVFSYRNTAERPVTITRLTTTCACTLSTPGTRTLAPGQSAELAAEFPVTSIGFSEQRIFLTTDDGNPPTTLTMQTQFDPPNDVSVMPQSLTLGPDRSATLHLTLTASAKPVPDLALAAALASHLTVTIIRNETSPLRTVGGRLTRWITLRITAPEDAPTPPDSHIRLTFTHPSLDPISVPVSVRVAPR